tara:strand:+ start:4812 stop:5921 length:1110 start_codon:yes stop_codon:yes gene_type:complete
VNILCQRVNEIFMKNEQQTLKAETNGPHLYIVGSPLHLLCAIEAKLTLGDKSTVDLFVLYTLCAKNNKQLDKLLLEYAHLWGHITSIKMRSNHSIISSISYLCSLVFKVKKLTKYELVFLSDPRVEVFQVLLSMLKYKELVITDDGLATINIYKYFCEKNIIFKESNNQSLSKYLIYKALNIKFIEPEKISFFSFLTLEDNKNIYHLYKCDFNHIKNLFQEKATTIESRDSHYFIGQKLVDVNLVTETKYLQLINDYINENINGNTLHYIPHRGESKSILIQLSANEQIKIVNVNVPIELFFLQESIQPSSLASFYSTALITLSLFLKCPQIKVIKLEKKDLLVPEYYSVIQDICNVIFKYLPPTYENK